MVTSFFLYFSCEKRSEAKYKVCFRRGLMSTEMKTFEMIKGYGSKMKFKLSASFVGHLLDIREYN